MTTGEAAVGRYEVEIIRERRWSGTLNPDRLEAILNRRAEDGWELARSITASERKWLLFKREAQFLVFEKA